MRRIFGKTGGYMVIHDFGALARQWRDLEAAGIPLEPLENRVGVDSRHSGSGLTIRAGRDCGRSEIRELKNGRFAYILPVFIRRDLPGKTVIRECWISPPWMDNNIELLEDPKYEEKHPGYYTFPGDTERFPREEVLNHRVNCNLSRGDIRKGLLLAVGSCPPETFKNYDKIVVTFTVMDQWDDEPFAKMQMRLNRFPARVKASNKCTRGPLFSRRDVIGPARSLKVPPISTTESHKKDVDALHRPKEGVSRMTSKHVDAKAPIGPKRR